MTSPNVNDVIDADADRPLTSLERRDVSLLPVGQRIRDARKRAGHSQERLADLVGVHRVVVNRWENNVIQPSRRYRKAIARETGMPLSYFRHDGRGGTP